MDQPKVERMLRLMQLLSGNVHYTIDEIGEKMELSRRSIYRYIDTFRSAGFAVTRIDEGTYRMVMSRKSYPDLSKIVYFSEEEAYVVNRLIDNLDNTNAMKQGLKRKLAAVYNMADIRNFIDNKANSANIEALSDAIREKRTVLLVGYSSSHSGNKKDYTVEPYKLNSNYIDFWAYDLEDDVNKRFKVSRIDEVQVLETTWEYEGCHEEEPLDAFRMHGYDPSHVRLKMDMVAKNLLLEEYPLAEKELTVDGDDWLWEGDVNGMNGVGRFVLGLPRHIEVLEGDELREFLRENAEFILKK